MVNLQQQEIDEIIIISQDIFKISNPRYKSTDLLMVENLQYRRLLMFYIIKAITTTSIIFNYHYRMMKSLISNK